MDSRYTAMAQPPQNALKPITIGTLKGKSDINPQWRIEALTEQFGLCGIGWKFKLVDTKTQELQDGQVLLFMEVALYVKDGEVWSEPIPGFGGDFLVVKNKNGLVPNDEAYKMCVTDALGNAAKCIGVAADIYRGNYDGSKYSNPAPVETVRKVDGSTQVLVKGSWHKLEAMTAEQLAWITSKPEFAACHDEAAKIAATRSA